MDLIAIVIAALLGWQNGTLGKREWQVIAIAVVGWSAVTSAASVPYLTLASLGFDLLYHAVVVTVPYVAGVLARRVLQRRR